MHLCTSGPHSTVQMLLLLGRIAVYYVRRCKLLLPSTVSVGLSVTFVNPAETAAPIVMLFGLRTWVSPRKHVLDGGPDPPWEGTSFFWGGGNGSPILKYRDALLSFVQKRLNRLRCCLSCGLGWAVGILCETGLQRC